MKKITLSALTLIAALAAGSAFANNHEGKEGHKGPHHGKHFQETDTDGDGSISKAEWTAKGDKMFSETDADNDGKITKEEMKAKHQAYREKREERREKMEEKKEKMDEKKGKVDEKKAATPAEKH